MLDPTSRASPSCHAGRARPGGAASPGARVRWAEQRKSREAPSWGGEPGQQNPSAAAPEALLGVAPLRRRGRSPIRPSRSLPPLRARTGRMGGKVHGQGGPEAHARASKRPAAPLRSSPALTVCRRPKPSAAQSSRWGGVGRGGEAAIESVASGGGKCDIN
uniref:Uncharacterized protein n=1 Tax=Sphaerodactylus townsendi TaxID=933632 RepID=A0ACB8FB85_9SAUR